jgi:lysophospholipase L1-like esterase
MRFLVFHALLALAAGPAFPQAQPETPKPSSPFDKWENEIATLEKKIRGMKPGGIVFAGSSSIRLWDVKKSFPDLEIANVGFGGSIISENTHFAPRLILPLKPHTIVFYAGDNDIAKKLTPEQVSQDFMQFHKLITSKLPKTRIIFLPIKPSLKRWNMIEDQKKANALIKEYCDKYPELTYLDLVPPMLTKEGKPREELFVKDGLHLSPAGYEIWTKLITPELKNTKPE